MLSGAAPGLTLNANGKWSGAPTTLGSFNFTVRVLDTNNFVDTHDYTLTVNNMGYAHPAFDSGSSHSCILRTDGSIHCWGSNLFGEATVPITIPNTNWVQVSAGWQATCGLKADGVLYCWGTGPMN